MSEEERVEAARRMGQARTEKKRQASLKSLQSARAARWTEERRKQHSEAMKRFWAERNKQPPPREETDK